MARIRTIKPEFFTSEDIVSISPLARLLYVAIWCEADRCGRLSWKPKTFKLRYLPADQCDIEELCNELVNQGLVRLYGDGLAYIPSFSVHQHINPRESQSSLPEPDASPTRQHASNLDMHAQVGKERKGKEGKGKEGDSEPNGSGGYTAEAVHAMAKNELWAAGKSLLVSAGLPEKQCGSFIGKLVKDFGDLIVVDAVRSAVVAQPANPIEYLQATCKALVGKREPNRRFQQPDPPRPDYTKPKPETAEQKAARKRAEQAAFEQYTRDLGVGA